ncbi:MAG: murein L,D-transpeptidase [Patescibacteria group bacterium]|nr:murein L,D-transpeptidase [Patescibacteria group bacterium]
MLQTEFAERIGNRAEIDSDYQNEIIQDALRRFAAADIKESQYFLYADRNSERQLIFVCFFDYDSKEIVEIGREKISTGNPQRKGDYFFTPTGIFKNTVKNSSYRALGTKNEQGWRGLGEKGSRVWDFGWQRSYKIINGAKMFIDIRLLLHATDPDFGEQRLGERDSKGCIRISGNLNRFLDHFGIIDKDYEKQRHWSLEKSRNPVFYQGEYLLVGDSGEFAEKNKAGG